MYTTEYPYYHAPFPTYNVAQSAVVPFLDQDVNLIISFRTAVGKTVLAEGAFAYHLSEEENSRVAFISPYRSLSSEKYKEWSDNFQLGNHGILLSTGDHMARPEEWASKRLAVITTESFDSKTRNERYCDWVQSLSCVVLDEAHLLGTSGRGAAMEAAMMRFTRVNPKARLILLSATMSNGRQVAQWVKSLNGKPTKFIHSDWRPNKLDIETHIVEDGFVPKIEAAVEIGITAKRDKKILIFVHSKTVGNEITKRIRKRGVKCAFHNASLRHAARGKIERMFSSSSSGLNVLVATSTLGAGVNVG
jgi:replicative superfamily II helicase